MTAINEQLGQVYKTQTAKMLAYLTSLTNNLSLAEEIWHETIATAIEQWPKSMPKNQQAWLFTVARNNTIDKLRQHSISLEKSRLLRALSWQDQEQQARDFEYCSFGDEQLKLIFSCCHPALSIDKQVPLTLSVVCGLTTTQIAEALVITRSTLEQRLTRAKRKLNNASIPFSIPQSDQLQSRLAAVLKVIYLVFNAADNDKRYTTSQLAPVNLANEAMTLVHNLNELLPEQAEIEGLFALMMFHNARQEGRYSETGALLTLDQQNRKLWDQSLIAKADTLLTKALKRRQVGSYQLQASIQGLHCLALEGESTDWRQIEALYHLLMKLDKNPVITLNAAVATSMAKDAAHGLMAMKACESDLKLQSYSLFHGAKADMLARIGDTRAAIQSYQVAISLTDKEKEIDFYQAKISQLKSKS